MQVQGVQQRRMLLRRMLLGSHAFAQICSALLAECHAWTYLRRPQHLEQAAYCRWQQSKIATHWPGHPWRGLHAASRRIPMQVLAPSGYAEGRPAASLQVGL